MNFIIREFIEKDYNDVIYLWERTDLGKPERGDNLETIENTVKHGGILLVMELIGENKIIGTSWITNDGRRLYLHHFGILPEFQGKGLSKLLVKESINYAKKKGLQIKLEVQKNNETAINLYKKFKFGYLGDYDVYIIRDYK